MLFAEALEMKKENLLAATVREPTARVTRARAAAASQSSKGLLSLDSSKQQCQKRDSRKTSKRVALAEKDSCAPTNQNKRRAVLRDVTNVRGDSLNTNCFNASNITVFTFCSFTRSEYVTLFFLYRSCLCNCLRR